MASGSSSTSRPARANDLTTHRLRRPAPAGAGWLAVLLLAGSACAAAPPAPKQAPAVAERVMAELRAANAARQQLLAERQAWAMEKEKLALLKTTVRGEAERFRAEAAKAKQAEAGLQKQLTDRRARQRRLQAVEAMVDALCERLEKALAALAGRSLPGVVPPDRAAGITEPGRRLAAAAGRLDDAERRAKQPAVELLSGTLAGRSMAVKVLRIGSVAAWWVTLDGKQAGTAAVEDGKLALHPVTKPADAQAIARAFTIVEGRATPDWLLLPVHRAKAKE